MAIMRRDKRVLDEYLRARVFEQLPRTVRDNVQMHIQRDLFDLKVQVTLRITGRKTDAAFTVDQEDRDENGVLIARVPDNVLAMLSVVA